MICDAVKQDFFLHKQEIATDVDNNQLSANTIITSRWYRKYWETISSICWIHSHSTKRLTCSLPLTFHIIVTSLNSDCGLCIMKRQKSLFYKLFTARWYANWQCLLTSNLRLAQLDWKIKPVLRLCFLNHFYLHTIICFRQTNMREHLNQKQYLNVFFWCVVWRLFSQFNLRLCFCNVKKILRWVEILAILLVYSTYCLLTNEEQFTWALGVIPFENIIPIFQFYAVFIQVIIVRFAMMPIIESKWLIVTHPVKVWFISNICSSCPVVP